jgi:hypothetical protein
MMAKQARVNKPSPPGEKLIARPYCDNENAETIDAIP